MAFTFTSYSFNRNTGEISLSYGLDDRDFTERLVVPVAGIVWEKVDTAAVDRALFALHLVGGMSYWKTLCPAEPMQVLSGDLDESAATYWTQQYQRGMSEFFFRNNIDWTHLAFFTHASPPLISHLPSPTSHLPPPISHLPSLSFLVPIGGGKDSTITALALQKAGHTFTTFAVQDAPPILATVKQLGTEHLSVQRFLDPNLIPFNKEPGVYNGHVPISLYWSFVALVTAIVHGKTDVLFSWEASASEGNTMHLGQVVNHQYSKSIDCERALQSYIVTHITPTVRIWSPLRPLTEFAIMGLFTKAPEFFPLFSSCNRNFTTKSLAEGASTFWCGSCAKCAFVFPLFAAWTSHAQACTTFGKDLFADESLLPLFAQLCGVEGDKPFECVGEAEETAISFATIASRGEVTESAAMQWFARTIGPNIMPTWRERAAKLCEPRHEQAVPEGMEYLVPDVSRLVV